jgi:hypothetical protein
MHSSQVLESIEVLLGKRKQGAEAGWRKILKENQWLIRATREWKPLPAPTWAWAGNCGLILTTAGDWQDIG